MRRFLCRSENSQALRREIIDDTVRQWFFRSHNRQVDIVFPGKPAQRLDIVRGDIDALGDLTNAGITGSAVDFFHPGTLGQLPHQRMFAAPAANDQDSHS